ncbi:MAG: ArsR/SmtB family transcription factor [Anaerolineales bacterium]
MAKRSRQIQVNFIRADQVDAAQPHLIDGLAATQLARVFDALSDPTRVRIVAALSHTELCVHDLAALLGMTQSAVSHQLRLMRALRLVKDRKEGRVVFYMLDDEHIHDLFHRGLEHVEHQ